MRAFGDERRLDSALPCPFVRFVASSGRGEYAVLHMGDEWGAGAPRHPGLAGEALMSAHSRFSGMIGLVCLALMTLLGCGGGREPAPEQAALPVGADESRYRGQDFSFTLPAGWVEKPAASLESFGEAASAVSVAPEGTAPSTLVVVLSYDLSGQPRESADGPRAWFDWYARTNEAEIVQAPSEISFDGGAALQGSLRWTDDLGNPVEVQIVRAVRADALYLIQCQTEAADGPVLAVGCAAIVESFRAT